MAESEINFEGYKILLTGGSGFLGRAIVYELLGDDSSLNIMKRGDEKDSRLLAD